MQKRVYGIDFLKLLSMFMVVMLHVLGQGGIIRSANPEKPIYWIGWFLEIFAFCAVNCYAIVSGYLSCNSTPKFSSTLERWLQVVFYTVGITAYFLIAFPEYRGEGMAKLIRNAFLPLSTKQYWYISAYFFMILFIPVLNAAVKHLSKKRITVSLCVAFGMIFLSHLLTRDTGNGTAGYDAYGFGGGYTVIWLMLLYLFGGAIKTHNIFSRVTKTQSGLMFLICICITFLSKYLLEEFEYKRPDLLIEYISPTIILAAVSLVIFCSKIHFPAWSRKTLALLSSASLGVYIIHVHPLIWNKYMRNCAKDFLKDDLGMALLKIFATMVVIFVGCLAIDLVRIGIFKLCRVNKICKGIAGLIKMK